MAEVQREFLLRWIPPDGGSFLELDAGDGVIGSHAVWLEEAGWLGDCFEERVEAARVLKKNRPRSCRVGAGTEAMFGKPVDLVTARRDSSINWITDRISDTFRPRRVIFQARDPEPEIFKAMNQAGYRLDHFIHDDEYYGWKG